MYSPNNGPQTLYYVPFLGDEASEDGLQQPIEDEVQRSDLNAVYPYVNADLNAQFGIAPTPMDKFPHGSVADAQHSFPFHSPRLMRSCVYDWNHSEPCQGFALELPLDIQTYLLELCTGSITPNRVPISIYEQLREFCNHAVIHLSSSVQGDDIPRIQPGAGPSMIRRDIDDFASAYPVPHIGANSTTSFSPSGVVGGPNPLQSAHYVSAPSPSSSTGMDMSIIGEAEIGPSVECRWLGGCNVRIPGNRPSTINAHLRRYHFPQMGKTAWDRETEMCQWDACDRPHRIRYSNLAKHIATVHLHSTSVVCPVPGCGQDCSRVDALKRHLRDQHGLQ